MNVHLTSDDARSRQPAVGQYRTHRKSRTDQRTDLYPILISAAVIKEIATVKRKKEQI